MRIDSNRISLTIDISLYGAIYLVFVYAVQPVLGDLWAVSGSHPASYIELFINMSYFVKRSYGIPVVAAILITLCLELKTNILNNKQRHWLVKLYVVLFILLTMFLQSIIFLLSPFFVIRDLPRLLF